MSSDQKLSPTSCVNQELSFYHDHLNSAVDGIISIYLHVRQAKNRLKYKVSSTLRFRNITSQRVRGDASGLSKKPTHLSVVLRLYHGSKANALERLIEETADLVAWCACAEIPTVSVYEKTGVLKNHIHQVYEAATQKLGTYFADDPEHCPGLSAAAPHVDEHVATSTDENPRENLRLYLISEQDGREPVLDLTKTLAGKSQKGELAPDEITLELVHEDLSKRVMPEPALLILFGPSMVLDGYPPWQSRLMEIYCLKDNKGFGYMVFINALRSFAGAEMRNGK